MQVQELLLQTLDELIDEDLKTFQWFCTVQILDSCRPFPVSRLQKAPRTVTVSKLIEAYGEDLAVRLTVEILKKMSNYNLAEKLKNSYGGPGAPGAP